VAQGDDDLGNDWRDRLAAAGRAVAGLVPSVGAALGEILTAIIPGQRADRIAEYLRKLDGRVGQLEAAVQRDILNSPAKIDLIEQGGFQAARALTHERIDQIVEVVTAGITQDAADVVRTGRLLVLLGELDDDEVAVLNAYGQSYANFEADAWKDVNQPERVHTGSSQEDIDKSQLYEAGRSHLLRLGLLRKDFSGVRHGQLPEFDVFKGDFKHRVQISALGRLLLRHIGCPAPFDLRPQNQVQRTENSLK
jgi:hypothetical protein